MVDHVYCQGHCLYKYPLNTYHLKATIKIQNYIPFMKPYELSCSSIRILCCGTIAYMQKKKITKKLQKKKTKNV